jgi:hypothetical protein
MKLDIVFERAERYACVAAYTAVAVSIPGFEPGLKSIARIQIGLLRRPEDRPDRDRLAVVKEFKVSG